MYWCGLTAANGGLAATLAANCRGSAKVRVVTVQDRTRDASNSTGANSFATRAYRVKPLAY